MMVSAFAVRLRLAPATVAAEKGTELEAALGVLGKIALKGKGDDGGRDPQQSPQGCSDHCRRGRLVSGSQGQPGLAPVICPVVLWEGGA